MLDAFIVAFCSVLTFISLEVVYFSADDCEPVPAVVGAVVAVAFASAAIVKLLHIGGMLI